MYVKPAGDPEGMVDSALDMFGMRDKWVPKSPAERQAEAAQRRSPQSDAPAAGHEENGYRFKGGDPANSKNWEKI
jgi:hypothetical protein